MLCVSLSLSPLLWEEPQPEQVTQSGDMEKGLSLIHQDAAPWALGLLAGALQRVSQTLLVCMDEVGVAFHGGWAQ